MEGLYNPLFIEDHSSYEQRIADLERQLEHHKAMSEQLQTIAILDNSVHDQHQNQPNKRKYRRTDKVQEMLAYVKTNMSNAEFAADLIAGVGLSKMKPEEIPKSLLRAYVAFRFRNQA